MDFTLSKQQQMVQKMYREFAENEVKPLAKKVDAEEYFPKETVEKMGKLGMMGIYFPTEVGGAGGDVLSYVMAVEELSKVCGTTGVIVSAHTSLCAAPIYENGTPEQKAKYLPKLCSGEWLGAFGLTEPGAGTDAQGQQTIAKEDGDYWVLNGSKIFITNAGFADVFIVIAVTDNVLDKRGRPTKLCSAFIVERTDPGFSVGKAEDKMGIRGSSTCELIFEDCRIPKDRMLGVRGKGFQLAMATLDGGRIGIASQALGIAEGALEETIAYVKERKQFGRAIAAFQNTQFELAEMKARVEAAKYLVYAAALKKQQAMDGAKVRYSVEAAQAHHVQQAGIEADLIVVGVVAVGARPADTDKRHEIPRTALLVAAHGVREIPHGVGVQVHHAEFFPEQAAVCALGVERSGRGPAFGLQARVADARTDRRREPFADMDVHRRSQALPEFSFGVVLTEIKVHTSGHSDENIIEKAIGFIRPPYDAVLRIPVPVFLGRSKSARENEQCNNVETFHFSGY